PVAPVSKYAAPTRRALSNEQAITVRIKLARTEPTVPVSAPTPLRSEPFLSVVIWACGIWILGVFALVLRLTVSLVIAGRIARSCVDISDGAFFVLALDAARRLGGIRRFSVRLGVKEATPAVPMTIGLFRPVVLLPRDAAQWSEDRLEAALLHELAHVRRWDWAWQVLASFACAIYWVNPLAWIAAQRLRAESEMACDDQVLVAGAPAADYAGHLLAMARTLSAARPGVPTAVAAVNRPQIETRLRAILDRARSRRALSPCARALALALAVVVLVPLGLLRFSSRAAAERSSHKLSLASRVSSLSSMPAFALEKAQSLSLTKRSLPMVKISSSIAKAAATLAGLTLLTAPIPTAAQSSPTVSPPSADQQAIPAPASDASAPQPPASPTAGDLAPTEPQGTPAEPAPAASPNPGVTIQPPSITYIPARPGDTTARIVTSDGKAFQISAPPQVVLRAPGAPQAEIAQADASADFYAGSLAGLPSSAVQKTGEDSFDIKVTNAPIQSLLSVLCQTAGRNYTIGPDVDTRVTVYLNGVSFENALTSILRATDPPVTYSQENGVYHFEARHIPQADEDQHLPQKHVTLDLDNAPFDKALKGLFDSARASYTIAYNGDKSAQYRVLTSKDALTAYPAAQTAVTVHLHDVPFPAALRALLNATSPALTYSVKDGIIYIRPSQAGYFSFTVQPDAAPTTYQSQMQQHDKDQAEEGPNKQGAWAKVGK
ncbi:MAG TPA: M56 family metallopeptidase, partial [Capsulimonadaceae bacterium]|nr:M56 family metallopeptidase [Capsulimonadaceae bacterium]